MTVPVQCKSTVSKICSEKTGQESIFFSRANVLDLAQMVYFNNKRFGKYY